MFSKNNILILDTSEPQDIISFAGAPNLSAPYAPGVGTTARSVEDKTRNAELNGNRNPE